MAYSDGRFEEALRHFRRAHELSERPELLYNIATAAERAGQPRAALEAFEQYLAALPGAENRNFVEARIRVLRQQLEEDRRAPTPEQTARAAEQTPGQAPEGSHEETGGAEAVPPSPTPEPPPDDDSLASKWWLWTALGVLVVGGAVTAVVLTTNDGGSGPSFADSDLGAVIRTLREP